MQKVSFAIAVVGTALSALAQGCNGAPPALTLATYDPYGASFYYGNVAGNTTNLMFDLTVQTPVTITSFDVITYDNGGGNPPVPDQSGNIARANIYTIPTTRVGNETNMVAWTLAAKGDLAVTAVPSVSPITNLKDPVTNLPFAWVLPAGSYGICIEYVPTTYTGTPLVVQNPGSLHTLGVNPNPGTPFADNFLSVSMDGIQQNGWQTVDPSGNLIPNTTINGTQDSINLYIHYTPSASAALFTQNGEGCYFRPHTFFQSLPASTTTPPMSNMAVQWLPLQAHPISNYLLTASSVTYTTPTTTSVTLGAYEQSSSTSWDDATIHFALTGWTFPFAGGNTTGDVTIQSNGCIYLADVQDSSYDACGSSYGGFGPFRDLPPRICPFFADFDPTVGGGIYFEENTSVPGSEWCRITYDHVPEWPAVAGFDNTIQVTLHASGLVEIFTGNLTNRDLNYGGNNAIIGFSEGNGGRLPSQINYVQSVQTAYQTGDGAIPPIMTMDARPVLGTSPHVITRNITPGTQFAFYVATLQGSTPQSLTPFGLTGCFAHVNYLPGSLVGTFLTGLNAQNEFSVTLPVPNSPAYQNVQFFFQAAPLTTGLNPAGILTSNGICTKLGL
ncbi:MAG: hypothetical protein U1E73_00050 [Planctomycetota bacterium]